MDPKALCKLQRDYARKGTSNEWVCHTLKAAMKLYGYAAQSCIGRLGRVSFARAEAWKSDSSTSCPPLYPARYNAHRHGDRNAVAAAPISSTAKWDQATALRLYCSKRTATSIHT